MSDIIDEVARISKLIISDIPLRENRILVFYAIRRLKDDEYTIEDWNMLAQYVMRDTSKEYRSIQEIKDALKI